MQPAEQVSVETHDHGKQAEHSLVASFVVHNEFVPDKVKAIRFSLKWPLHDLINCSSDT